MPSHSAEIATGTGAFAGAMLPENSATLADAILADAREREFQAISIAPHGEEVLLRGRASGRIRDIVSLPAPVGLDLVATFKRLAGLNPADLRSPQRGTATLHDGRRIVVSTLPCRDAERISVSFPSDPPIAQPLLELGLPPRFAGMVSESVGRRGSIVLVSGPPQSGRSRTLAGILGLAASRRLSTFRIAPLAAAPVVGVGDHPAGAASPALALRETLALDPDLVGIDPLDDPALLPPALEATESGASFVLSIPLDGALAALGWLRRQKLDRFALANSLRLVLAQRLVRRLCASCRRPVQASRAVSARLGFDPGAVVFEPAGCAQCDGTGFDGDTAVFEAIEIDSAMRRLVLENADEALIARHAFMGSPRMSSAARTLVREGVTTPDEAVRIARTESAVVND